MAKRMDAAELDVRSKRFTVMGLKGSDRLACAASLSEGDDILLITQLGMGIRFAAETVPAQGRTSGGVRGIGLAPEDRVILAAPLRKGQELLLVSDRGNGKRIPAMGFERQGRGGKGVRAFPFAKNGANGTAIAGALVVTEPFRFNIVQKNGTVTPCVTEDVAIEPRTGRGQPYVMVVMDDVVTELVRA